jgi:hemolysin-activating ACP:hemolysin acyltransferase
MPQPVPAMKTIETAPTVRMPLKAVRPENPYLALGLAVSHLMTKPAFANRQFGDWSRILVGQINRKHYLLVVDADGRVCGFLGWALVTKDEAEAWFENRRDVAQANGKDGDCIVCNAWAASTPAVNRFMVQEARKAAAGRDTVYFKRFYDDGTTRPVRLRVNDLLAQHLAGGQAAAASPRI